MNKHDASHSGGCRKSFSGLEHTDAIVLARNKLQKNASPLLPALSYSFPLIVVSDVT